MALTRNDKFLILGAVILAAMVVGALAWWRTSGSLPPVPAPAQNALQEHKVEAPKDAKPAVSAPIGVSGAAPASETRTPEKTAQAPSPAAPASGGPAVPANPASPGGPEPDKSLATIFSEKPAPALEPEPAPAAPAVKAPEIPAAPAPKTEPAPAPEKKKPETPAERRARLAAEKKAEAEAKRAEAEAKKARAETLRRAQEELRKAEAELKAAQAKLKKEQETKAKQVQEASARQAKPESAPEAKPAAPDQTPAKMGAPEPAVPATPNKPAAPAPSAPSGGIDRHVVDKITVTEAGSDIVVTLPGASTKDKPEALILTTPPRLVIDLPGQWAYQVTGNPSPQLVKALRVGKHSDKMRLVLDLAVSPKGPKHPAVEKTAEGLVVRIAK